MKTKMGSSNGKYKLTTQDIQDISATLGMNEVDIQRRFEQFTDVERTHAAPNTYTFSKTVGQRASL